jgi:hypothetical protein
VSVLAASHGDARAETAKEACEANKSEIERQVETLTKLDSLPIDKLKKDLDDFIRGMSDLQRTEYLKIPADIKELQELRTFQSSAKPSRYPERIVTRGANSLELPARLVTCGYEAADPLDKLQGDIINWLAIVKKNDGQLVAWNDVPWKLKPLLKEADRQLKFAWDEVQTLIEKTDPKPTQEEMGRYKDSKSGITAGRNRATTLLSFADGFGVENAFNISFSMRRVLAKTKSGTTWDKIAPAP